MASMSETARLLDAARAGDLAARDDLYARHLGRLLAFIRARLSPRARRVAAPEDIVQETHLESTRKLDAFEYQGEASFYRWLVSIARFKLSEADRAGGAGKRAAAVPLAETPAARQTSPSGGAIRQERAARLHDALHALDSDRGEAVRLRYLEGLSVREAAERLDKSPAAVKALVSRGLADLAGRICDP